MLVYDTNKNTMEKQHETLFHLFVSLWKSHREIHSEFLLLIKKNRTELKTKHAL